MKRYICVLFCIYSSLGAVKGVPERDSKTVIFEEHPPVNHEMSPFDKKSKINENDKPIPSLHDCCIKSSDDDGCDVVDCTIGFCTAGGVVKLLACFGIL